MHVACYLLLEKVLLVVQIRYIGEFSWWVFCIFKKQKKINPLVVRIQDNNNKNGDAAVQTKEDGRENRTSKGADHRDSYDVLWERSSSCCVR